MDISEAYMKQIEKKIAEGGNGEVDQMVLALAWANYQKLDVVEKNPAVQLGTFARQNKGLMAFLLGLMYLLTVLIPEIVLKLMGFDPIKWLP